MPVLLHREVSEPAQWVHRKLTVQSSQFDNSDIALIPTRDSMIFADACESPNPRPPIYGTNEQRWSTKVRALAHQLTVPFTFIIGQLGINSTGLQTVSKRNLPVITSIRTSFSQKKQFTCGDKPFLQGHHLLQSMETGLVKRHPTTPKKTTSLPPENAHTRASITGPRCSAPRILSPRRPYCACSRGVEATQQNESKGSHREQSFAKRANHLYEANSSV